VSGQVHVPTVLCTGKDSGNNWIKGKFLVWV